MKNSTSFNLVLSSVLFLTLIFTGNAQLQNANWYFGNGAGLNFNDGTAAPIALTNSAMVDSDGGVATVSDIDGNILFYTNGHYIWHQTHQIMQSGAELFGSKNVSQSVVVVQNPFDQHLYYIITNQGFETGSNGLSYSVVDISANSGWGNVINNQKNVQLLPYSSEKLTAVFNPTNNSYWIISFGPSTDPEHSDTFTVFKLEGSNGITLHNQFTFSFLPDAVDQRGGQMKISPNGTTLAMIHNTAKYDDDRLRSVENIFSFNFEMSRGEITSLKSYSLDNVLYAYGLEFSPDSDKFFVTTTHQIQDELAINKFYQIWFRNATPEYTPVQFIGTAIIPTYSLQLALDGNIYGATNNDKLHRISNPDGLSQDVGFACSAIDLNGRSSTKGLPQPVLRKFLSEENIATKVYTVLNNPFDDELKIKYHVTGKFKMKMYKMSGKKVKNKEVSIRRIDQVIEIDTRRLTSGVYILNVKDKDDIHHNETVLKLGGYGHGHGDDDDD